MSKSESVSVTEKPVIKAHTFRTLGPNQALALLSVGGASADDVLECIPVFID
jgi:hypothetical protein